MNAWGLVALWIVCGVVSVGIDLAEEQGERRFTFEYRDMLKDALFINSLGGPIALVCMLFVSRGCRHGWRLWPKKELR